MPEEYKPAVEIFDVLYSVILGVGFAIGISLLNYDPLNNLQFFLLLLLTSLITINWWRAYRRLPLNYPPRNRDVTRVFYNNFFIMIVFLLLFASIDKQLHYVILLTLLFFSDGIWCIDFRNCILQEGDKKLNKVWIITDFLGFIVFFILSIFTFLGRLSGWIYIISMFGGYFSVFFIVEYLLIRIMASSPSPK